MGVLHAYVSIEFTIQCGIFCFQKAGILKVVFKYYAN